MLCIDELDNVAIHHFNVVYRPDTLEEEEQKITKNLTQKS
jgi:hypothetical protein